MLGELDRNKIYAGVFVLVGLLMITLMGDREGNLVGQKQHADLLLRTIQAGARLNSTLQSQGEAQDVSMFPDPFEPTQLMKEVAVFDPSLRDEMLYNLAILAAATGHREAGANLAAKAGVGVTGAGDFRFLWSDQAELPGSEEILSSNLELLPLADWVRDMILADYLRRTSQVERSRELTASVLAAGDKHVMNLGLLFFALMALGLAGLVLFGFRRRLMARYSGANPYYLSGMFRSTMPETLAIFLLWFSGSVAVNSTLAKPISAGFSPGAATLLLYSTTAILGFMMIRILGTRGFAATQVPNQDPPKTRDLVASLGLGLRDLNLRSLAWGGAGYLVALPVVFTLSLLSQLLLGGGEADVNPIIPILVDSLGSPDKWIITLNVAVVAPLFEEFFFRGFLMDRFQKYLGMLNAILLSALVFGAIHLSLPSFLPLMGLGVILAVVARYSGSLWSSVVTHGLWNLTTVISLIMFYG